MATAPATAQTQTPASTTTTAPAEGAPATDEIDSTVLEDDPEFDDGFDFASFRKSEGEEPVASTGNETPAAVTGGAQPETGTPAVVSPPAAAAPAVAATPVAAPAAQVQAPASAAPVAPQVQAPTQSVEQSLEAINTQYRGWRDSRVKELANSHFKLTDEQVEALATDPSAVVPQLMAQAAVSATESSVIAIANMLPNLVNHMLETNKATEQAKSDFIAKWPALADRYDDPLLLQIGTLYRQMNPRASKEEFIATVGANGMIALGLQAVQAQAPVAPMAPVLQQRPHSPFAASAPRAAGLQPVAQDNKFAALLEDGNDDE